MVSRVERLNEEEDSGEGDGSAGESENELAWFPEVEDADGDAEEVEGSGGDDETHGIKEAVLTGGEFVSVGISVEEAEETDEGHGDREGRAGFEEDHEAKEDGGGSNADFIAGKGNADEADEAAEGHDHGEGDRKDPDGGFAELCAPESDGDHCADVIPARPWMFEPTEEAAGFACEDVGVGVLRQQENGEKCPEKREPSSKCVRLVHDMTPSRMAILWMVQKAPSPPTVYAGIHCAHCVQWISRTWKDFSRPRIIATKKS